VTTGQYLRDMNRATRALLFIAAIPVAACAQGFPASQRQTIAQNVALTKFEIAYGRPVAKGRTLFGQLVPWNEVWIREPTRPPSFPSITTSPSRERSSRPAGIRSG
jgi:hypothetical protein